MKESRPDIHSPKVKAEKDLSKLDKSPSDEFSERITNIIADAVMIRGSQSTRYSYAIQRGMKEALDAVQKEINSLEKGPIVSPAEQTFTQATAYYVKWRKQFLIRLKSKITAWKEELK